VHTGFWWVKLRARDHLEEPGVDGWIVLKNDLQYVGWGTIDWINLAEDGDSWRAVVSAVMNLRVAASVGCFLTS